MKQLFSQLRLQISRFRRDEDLEDELSVHLEMETEDKIARGLAPIEARRLASIKLGRTSAVIERMRDQEWITVLESWVQDFLVGMRLVGKRPFLCGLAIVTLACGIGANNAIFVLLYGLLLRSLPVTAPQELAY